MEEAGGAGGAGRAGRAPGSASPAQPASPAHAGHAESEIGRGFSSTSLKSELGSMRARLVVEAGAWSEMRGQDSFENIDELFALGYAALKLGDAARAAAAVEASPERGEVGSRRGRARHCGHHGAGARRVAPRRARRRGRGLAALAARRGCRGQRGPDPSRVPIQSSPQRSCAGEALLASGDASGAVKQFRASLARTPRRAAALLGTCAGGGESWDEGGCRQRCEETSSPCGTWPTAPDRSSPKQDSSPDDRITHEDTKARRKHQG